MKNIIFGCLLTLIIVSCKPTKNISASSKVGDVEIQFAIDDFSKARKPFVKKHKVYILNKRVALNNSNIFIVDVFENDTKLLLTENAKIGSKGELPSKFVVKDGNLFYWWDNDSRLTEEAMQVFRKYNLLQDDGRRYC